MTEHVPEPLVQVKSGPTSPPAGQSHQLHPQQTRVSETWSCRTATLSGQTENNKFIHQSLTILFLLLIITALK